MSVLHVASPAGDRSQYEEEPLRALWKQGRFSPGSLYWRDGMADWRPLSEFFAAATTVGAAPGAPAVGVYRYTKDPHALTSFLKAMLWICLGFEVVAILGGLGQLWLLSSEFTEAQAMANDAIQGLIAILYLIVFLVTGIAFLKWIYRANKNCRGFGAVGMRFTPGWAIGYFFVPFLNLIRPYEAMKEIWQVSHKPVRWMAQRASPLVGWWWALWLFNNFLGQASVHLSRSAGTLEGLQWATTMSILSSLVGIPLSLVALAVVSRIAARQDQLTGYGFPMPANGS